MQRRTRVVGHAVLVRTVSVLLAVLVVGCRGTVPTPEVMETSDKPVLCKTDAFPRMAPVFSGDERFSCDPFHLPPRKTGFRGPVFVGQGPTGRVVLDDPFAYEFLAYVEQGGEFLPLTAALQEATSRDNVTITAFSAGYPALVSGAVWAELRESPDDPELFAIDPLSGRVVVGEGDLPAVSPSAVFEAGKQLQPVDDCESLLASLPAFGHWAQPQALFEVEGGGWLALLAVSNVLVDAGSGNPSSHLVFYGSDDELVQMEHLRFSKKKTGEIRIQFAEPGGTAEASFDGGCEPTPYLALTCPGTLVREDGTALALRPSDFEDAQLDYICKHVWMEE